jgi:uracil-DNA glycosylase
MVIKSKSLEERWAEEDEIAPPFFNPATGEFNTVDNSFSEKPAGEAPHVGPLMDLVRSMRSSGLFVPSVDPQDGGVNAKALFLLETPGPIAVRTQFVSQDNPDPTAANMKASLAEAGFQRSDVVIWNVVPQYLSEIGKSNHATAKEIREASPHTQAFIGAIPELRALVFCGKQAQRALSNLQINSDLQTFQTYHTGAMSFNHKRLRNHIRENFFNAYVAIKKNEFV